MMRRWLVPALIGLVAALIAYQATLLATPFALMRAAAARAGKGLPVNRFAFGPMTTAGNQTIVRPSPDLSYSLCVFDVSKGPVLVESSRFPAITGRSTSSMRALMSPPSAATAIPGASLQCWLW